MHSFYTLTKKHREFFESEAFEKTMHGAKKSFKTPSILWYILKKSIKYFGSLHTISRESLGQCRDEIYKFYTDLEISQPEFYDSIFLKSSAQPAIKLWLKNTSIISCTEISRKADKKLMKLQTSFKMNTFFADDCANYMDASVHESLKYNYGKNKCWDQVALNNYLLESGKIQKTKYHDLDLDARYNPSLQIEFYRQNSQFLNDNYDYIRQDKIKEPFKCPDELLLSLNPTSTGFWHRRFVLKQDEEGQPLPEREAKKIFSVNFHWRDVKDFLEPEYIEDLKAAEKIGGQYYQMMGAGQPCKEAKNSDVFPDKLTKRAHKRGQRKSVSMFYDRDGLFKADEYIELFGTDSAFIGDDEAVIANAIYEIKTGDFYLIGFPYVKKESSDRLMEEFLLKILKDNSHVKPEHIGSDANGNNLWYNLKRDHKIIIKPFFNDQQNIPILKQEKFKNIRTQLYFTLRKLFEQDKIIFMFRDIKLDEELSASSCVYSDDGLAELVKKKRMGIGRSPDRLDALAYCIATIMCLRKFTMRFDTITMR